MRPEEAGVVVEAAQGGQRLLVLPELHEGVTQRVPLAPLLPHHPALGGHGGGRTRSPSGTVTRPPGTCRFVLLRDSETQHWGHWGDTGGTQTRPLTSPAPQGPPRGDMGGSQGDTSLLCTPKPTPEGTEGGHKRPWGRTPTFSAPPNPQREHKGTPKNTRGQEGSQGDMGGGSHLPPLHPQNPPRGDTGGSHKGTRRGNPTPLHP